MLKTEQGRRAVTAVLVSCAEHTRLVSHLKKFALACKFFEYIFEPALAEQNSIFYNIGFHLYIGNLLFMIWRAQDTSPNPIPCEPTLKGRVSPMCPVRSVTYVSGRAAPPNFCL